MQCGGAPPLPLHAPHKRHCCVQGGYNAETQVASDEHALEECDQTCGSEQNTQRR